MTTSTPNAPERYWPSGIWTCVRSDTSTIASRKHSETTSAQSSPELNASASAYIAAMMSSWPEAPARVSSLDKDTVFTNLVEWLSRLPPVRTRR